MSDSGYRESVLSYMRRYRKENRERLNRQQRERKAYYVARGICPACLKNRHEEGKRYCEECLAKQRERYRLKKEARA